MIAVCGCYRLFSRTILAQRSTSPRYVDYSLSAERGEEASWGSRIFHKTLELLIRFIELRYILDYQFIPLSLIFILRLKVRYNLHPGCAKTYYVSGCH